MHASTKRGSIILMATLGLFFMFGCIGLVVDLGMASFKRQQAQSAADAAAAAASVYALSNGSTCGLAGISCNSVYTCPYPPTTPPSNPLEAGCLYAGSNGFYNNGSQTVTLIQGSSAPPGLIGSSPSYWVEADVSDTKPTLFGNFARIPALTVATRATAGISSDGGGGTCVYALGSTGTGVTISNAGNFTTSCAIVSNSGLLITNLLGNLSAPSISYRGTYLGIGILGTVSPTPVKSTTAVTDPFRSLTPPTFSGCDHSSYIYAGGTPLQPGVYCDGLTVANLTSATFEPGTYIINGGSLSISSVQSISGNGVTFFITGQSGKIPAPVVLTNVNSFGLTAPGTGKYAGVLVYQDPSVSYALPNIVSSLGGNGSSGALYFPTTSLAYTGTGNAVYQAIVAQSVIFTGVNAFLTDTVGTKTGLAHTTVGLIN